MNSQVSQALVIGAGGQDGTILRRSLGMQGITVTSVYRSHICYADGRTANFTIFDPNQVETALAEIEPEWIFYLAAHHTSSELSSNKSSNELEYEQYHRAHVVGLHILLEAMRRSNTNMRLFYASSSLIFNGEDGVVQTEETPFTPVGFYGLTKLQGMLLCRYYRNNYNLFASAGILYSHESIYRPDSYLSKKIILAAAAMSKGMKKPVTVGSLEAINDWGYAQNFIDAFQRILKYPQSTDFIVATGEGHTVREFATIVCERFGLRLSDCILEDKSLPLRRTSPRVGDYGKLHSLTGWTPKYSFSEMINRLIDDFLIETAETCGHNTKDVYY